MKMFVQGNSLPKNKKIIFLINIYIFLILYDGIFRKWLLPSMSSAIMPVKQLVAVLIVIYGFRYVKIMTVWEKSFAIIGLMVFLLTLLLAIVR